VRSWQSAYKGLLPAEYLDSLRADERASRYDFASADPLAPHTIVADDGRAILGFATVGISPDATLRDVGELMALYVDPDAWGTGVGRALIARVRDELCRRAFKTAVLWVLDGNTRAERFYERDGWTRGDDRRRQRVWGIHVDEVAYRRRL
jgi:GNAT superfamily N-acetyltransferase